MFTVPLLFSAFSVRLQLAVTQWLVPREAASSDSARQLPKNVTNINARRLKLFIFVVISDSCRIGYSCLGSVVWVTGVLLSFTDACGFSMISDQFEVGWWHCTAHAMFLVSLKAQGRDLHSSSGQHGTRPGVTGPASTLFHHHPPTWLDTRHTQGQLGDTDVNTSAGIHGIVP